MFGFKKKTPVEEPATQEPQSKPKPAAAIQPEALGTGFAAKAGKALKNRAAQIDEAAGYANGGMVRGKGTGTSDSIETEVPQGSYIMPADSTEKLGEQTVAGMGAPTPVNLSNGEYQLPPEQVHAVGVQALDQMKDATHTQVPTQGSETQGLGFQPASQKPELFLANGGLVDETLKGVKGAYKAVGGAVLSPFGAVVDGATDLAYDALGADKTGKKSYLDANMNLAKEGMNDMSQSTEAVRGIARDALGLKAATPATAAAPSVRAAPVTAVAQQRPVTARPATASTTPAPQSVPTQAAPALDPNQSDNNVTRVGNSYSGSNIREGFTVNGQPQSNGGYMVTPAVSTPSAATPQGQQPAGFVPGGGSVLIGDSSVRDRQNLARTISAPIPGARGMTATQRNQLQSLQESSDRNELTAATSADNNATRLAEAGMQSNSAFQRSAMQEEGANRRADANNRIDQQKVDGESEARGFQSRALARQEKLYQKYESAKPEERAAIAQQIRDLSGKADPQQNLRENFMTRKAPVTDAKGNVVGERDEIVDLRTGQPIGQQTNSAPKAGEQRGGYRFKGGNPADQKNWERI